MFWIFSASSLPLIDKGFVDIGLGHLGSVAAVEAGGQVLDLNFQFLNVRRQSLIAVGAVDEGFLAVGGGLAEVVEFALHFYGVLALQGVAEFLLHLGETLLAAIEIAFAAGDLLGHFLLAELRGRSR